jgi:hypothetical protein
MTFSSPGSWLLISMLQTTIAGSLPKPSWLAERERHGQTLVVLDIDDDRSGVCPQLIVGYMPLQSAADLRAQQEWLSNNMFHVPIEASQQRRANSAETRRSHVPGRLHTDRYPNSGSVL